MRRVVRRGTAWLGGLGAALALAACGVPPSGVIQAGEPAKGLIPPYSVNLYFVVGGDLRPFRRTASEAVGISTAVSMLFTGPTSADQPAPVTELPPLSGEPRVLAQGGKVVVDLSDGVAPLDEMAMRQLACTVSGVSGGRSVSVSPTTAPPDPADTAVPDRPPPLPGGSSGGADLASGGGGDTTLVAIGSGWTRALRESDAACPDAAQG